MISQQVEDRLAQLETQLAQRQEWLETINDLRYAPVEGQEVALTLRHVAVETARVLKAISALAVLDRRGTPISAAWGPHPPTLEELAGITVGPGSLQVVLGDGGRKLVLLGLVVEGDQSTVAVVDHDDNVALRARALAVPIARQAGAVVQAAWRHGESVKQARIQNEYELAAKVQSRLLAGRPVPSLDGVEIYAESRPALLVGGDFFNFAGGKGRPTFFAVGDVSGKGLPAAILVTMTLASLYSKAEFLPHPTPETILARVNEDLYPNFTDVGMFATMLVGHFDPDDQMVSFANGGHSPVIHKPKGAPGRLIEADGTALGVLTESFAEDRTVRLGPNDLFVVASDGLVEQRNTAGVMFGYDALMSAIERSADLPASRLAAAIFDEVAAFAGNAPQDDDQTLLVLRGSGAIEELTRLQIPAELTAMDRIAVQLAEAIRRHPARPILSAVERYTIELAVHEACVNIVRHGYRSADGVIELVVSAAGPDLVIDLYDNGPSFDPTNAPTPDLAEPQVHGYGVFIIRELMDSVSYQAGDEQNRLRLTKRVAPSD